jgi:hypothetical protein
VYKRGKNKDSFGKKQYFFSNFCPQPALVLVFPAGNKRPKAY